MNMVISTRTIFTTLVVLFFLWVGLQIRDLIVSVFVAFLLSVALVPLVDKLQMKKLPRGLANLIVYLAFIAGLLLLLAYGFSPMVEQTVLFLSQLPKLLDNLLALPLIEPIGKQLIENLTTQLSTASGSVVKLTLNIFSSIFSLVTVIILSFYFSLEFHRLKEKILVLARNGASRQRLNGIMAEIEQKIGGWIRGELLLILVIGLMTYLGLTVLRMNYALPLAVIAGILEIVPVIGPVISAVPAVVVGLSASPLLGLGVAALFILIQQFENSLIVPKVMQKVIGLDPILTLLVILVGGKVFGLLGALLSVPVTLVLIIILKNFYWVGEKVA